ncbi:MAG: M20/M25/M40 family metallo-hydrolase [Planctomycetota bacterium]|nr:MAG: M20/M25/M40 family metallo-hydrolase [Planctomycetota bacterium]
MIRSLALASCVVSAAAAQQPREPVAILHGGLLRSDAALARCCELWWDGGTFGVGAVDDEQRAGLLAEGVVLVPLPPLSRGEELYAFDAHEPDWSAPAGTREVFRFDGRVLVAATSERECELRESDAAGRPHCGPLRIATTAAAAIEPAPPVVWRGARADQIAVSLTQPDARISAVAAAIDKARIVNWTTQLAAIPTRRANLAGATTAQNMLVAELQSYGYAPILQTFNASMSRNVIAEIPGTLFPNKVVIAGAHYDSINQSGPSLNAPGADDNASGTAALLEIARALKLGGAYEHTVRCVFFSGEELGLLGSAYNAQQAKLAGEQVLGMLNMDMVAYRKPGDIVDCDFTTNSSSTSLTGFCDAISALHVPGWASWWDILDAGSSDHASYNTQGIPAAYFSEDLPDYYGPIHTLNDTVALACTDFDLAKLIAQGVAASAAALAEPLDLAIAHAPLADVNDGVGPYLVSAQITSLTAASVASATLHWSFDGGAQWSSAPMSASGSTYSALIPGAGSPLVVRYYVSATDTAGGTEDLPTGAALGGEVLQFFAGSKTTLYANGFEAATDEGWTHGAYSGTDDWARGTPAGKGGDPAQAFAGAKAWGTDLTSNGEYAANGWTWLRSPAINCASAANVHVEFARWLTVDDRVKDSSELWCDNQLVWRNPAGAPLTDFGWRAFDLDVTAQAAGKSAVVFEFRIKANATLNFGGWNLDQFAVTRWNAAPPPGPPVFALAPATAQAIGGAAIAASGSGLGGATSVTVGGAPVAFTQGAGQVAFALPQQLALGSVDVVVTTAQGSGSAALAISATSPPAQQSPPTHATGATLVVPVGSAGAGWSWLVAASQPGATVIPGLVTFEIGNGNLLDLRSVAQAPLSAAGTATLGVAVPAGTGLAGVTVWLEALFFDGASGALDTSTAASCLLQ